MDNNIILIDEEFRSLLPKLDDETYAMLESSIKENGCREALVLWGNTLIDGHNRYEICSRLGIPYNTMNLHFNTREEVLIWIISTQVSRRNLTPLQMSHFRGLHYRTLRKLSGNTTGRNQHNIGKVEYAQNEHIPQTIATADFLATNYNVSQATVRRDAKVSEAIDAIGEASIDAKNMVLSGEVLLRKKDLAELSFMAKEEIASLAMKIEDGTYKTEKTEKTPAAPPQPVEQILIGIRQLEKPISKMWGNFTAALPKITRKDDKTRLQQALRPYIDTLEEMYSKI